MDVSLNYILSQAYDLIEANRIDEARGLLEPLLVSHADDVDVWWLYAHSVNDPHRARRALDRVQSLDALRYPRAKTLLQDLDTIVMPMSLNSFQDIPVTQSTTSLELPTEEQDDESDDDKVPSRLAIYGLPAVVAVIVTIVVVFALFSPTDVLDNVTIPSSATLMLDQVLLVPTVSDSQSTVVQMQSLPNVMFVNLPMLQKSTALGDTTLFQLCLEEFELSPSQLVNDAMKEIAEQLPTLNLESQAVGVEMNFCVQNTSYRSVAVAIATAEMFARGGLTEIEYRRSIQAVD